MRTDTFIPIGSFCPGNIDPTNTIWVLKIPSLAYRVLYVDTGYHTFKADTILATMTERGSKFYNLYNLEGLQYVGDWLKQKYNIEQRK